MSIPKKITVRLVSIAISLPTIVLGQQTVDGGIQAAVVTAVAQSLGADPDNLPSYEADLKAARRTADIATLCGPGQKAQFLTPDIANKVIARAVELLRQENDSLWERPRYVRDLIVISAASFEVGRLAGTDKDYRAALGASAPTGSSCKVAEQ